jgi:diaminopimelate decarboxylase
VTSWLARFKQPPPEPWCWGLERRDGQLHLDGINLNSLASQFRTPLHVASARTLESRYRELVEGFAGYSGSVQICYSYKTNRVAGIVRTLHRAGCGAEVVDEYEIRLALQLGVDPGRIVLNGANKSDVELRTTVHEGIGLVVVDGFLEIDRLDALGAEADRVVPIALRICPDVKPHGMNVSSITGSRRTPFGFDLKSGEVQAAIEHAISKPHLRLRGVMAHIGSGIHHLKGVGKSVERLLDVQLDAARMGAEPDILDVGGGLGTRLSREFTTFEMLRYLAIGRLPRSPRPAPADFFSQYGTVVTDVVTDGCRRRGLELPKLILEPGRSLVSDAQVLLLSVGAVRERPGIGRFAITDGGAMTVSMMFLSEHHAVLLANRDAPLDDRTHVFGRLPSPMDVVYRGARLPRLERGDLLAVMDAGAYFTSTETTFGGARPAVVLIENGEATLIRRRETYEDRVALECVLENTDCSGGDTPTKSQ